MLTVIVVVLLLAIIAVLWYAVRTHKTVAELKTKIVDKLGGGGEK